MLSQPDTISNTQQFRPALEEISTRYSGVRFIEVDGTALPGVYTEMGAQETPFIVLMQGGQKVAGFGHISKSSVEKALERHGAESNVITAPPTVAETPDAVTETTVSAPGASGAAGGGGVTDVQSEAEFTRIVSENDYCVIDFYASWCGACKVYSIIKPNGKKMEVFLSTLLAIFSAETFCFSLIFFFQM